MKKRETETKRETHRMAYRLTEAFRIRQERKRGSDKDRNRERICVMTFHSVDVITVCQIRSDPFYIVRYFI